MPLYRQELLFKQTNVVLNRQNMSNWLVEASNILKPVVDLIQEKIKESKFIHADETTFQVLKENNRKPSQKGYLWTYSTAYEIIDCATMNINQQDIHNTLQIF